MRFSAFIARRYFSSRNKPFFVWLLTFISLFGMAVSVFALIVVVAIMEGFEEDFQKRIIAFKAPLVVQGPPETDWTSLAERVGGIDPRIRAVPRYLEGESVLQTGEGENIGVRVRGVSGDLTAERFGDLRLSDSMEPQSIVVGRELAYALRLDPESFDRVRLIFPFGEVGPTGDLVPAVRRYTVSGSFRTGFYEFDSKQVLVEYAEAARLLKEYGRYGLEIWIRPLSAVGKVQDSLQAGLKGLPGVTVHSWREQNPKLFAALKLERWGMALLLAVLVVIASSTLFGLISLTVLEKMGDLAVLRSLGLSRGSVRWIFLLKAAGIGILGDLAGLLVGGATVSFLIRHPVRLPTTYYVEYLPLTLSPGLVLGIGLLAPLLAVAAALYPAFASTRLSPVELLRYE